MSTNELPPFLRPGPHLRFVQDDRTLPIQAAIYGFGSPLEIVGGWRDPRPEVGAA